MPKTHFNSTAKALLQLSLLQAVATLGFSVGVYVCFSTYEAVSAALGGLVVMSANLYLAIKARKPIEVGAAVNVESTELVANNMLQRFYRFEVLKVVFTITMFVIAIVFLKVAVLPFIIAYLLAALVVTWLSFLMLDRDEVQDPEKIAGAEQ